MKTADLLLSSLHITEDDYIFSGTFNLSYKDKSMTVDVTDLQNDMKIREIKTFFDLEESEDEILNTLMNMVIEKSAISSRIIGS